MARTRKHKTDDEGRECSECNCYKSWDEYYNGAGTNGKDTRCKECVRAKRRAGNKNRQEAEHLRWQARWEAAHPGEVYQPRSPAQSAQDKYDKHIGVTQADREQLAAAAVFGPGLCDLHGGPETLRHHSGAVRSLCIDHDHDCEQHPPSKMCRYCIRGLVCCECNRNIIRKAEQFPALAARFQDYLDRRPLLSAV